MKPRLKRHIVLIGMMGAGKTALGTELSRRLRVPFTDSDAEIESAAAMSISEIFARDGEPFFRARETEVLGRILTGPRGVISTGGGAWMRAENRSLIAGTGVSVWLNAELDTLWHRVRLRPTRPLLQTADPRGTLERLLAERNPVYAQADVNFAVQRADTIDQSTDRLIEALRRHDPDLYQDGK
ncbi:shikimate kinase [Paracoccus sp. (in: a-proteobacteria)]|uniref:shikimate kinase n=1 Tax=Paracoccus sp. TaxID=267 RepID=UPI0026E03582|nr:shikimate kinase [Paracoccus sp. (in: a-proteobacteria)]MDO5648933.1 shikimate kinase [Paracoccus sp. (in: a-proteobacteria)]